MGFDLLIRSDRLHRQSAQPEQVQPLLERFGFRQFAPRHWTLDRDCAWMEVYLSTVAPRQEGSDVIEPATDGSFNEISCHPKALNPSSAAMIYALAAALRWEIFDPQSSKRWREAGRDVPVAGRCEERSPCADVGAERLQPVERIQPIPDGCWLVSVGKGKDSTLPPRLERLAARDLNLLEVFEARSRAEVSIDGARIASEKWTRREYLEPLQTRLIEGDTWQTWPAHPDAAWLPNEPAALLAITHPWDEWEELAKLSPLSNRHVVLKKAPERLFVIDVDKGEVFPLRAEQLDGSSAYGSILVSPDGSLGFFVRESHVHTFDMDTGTLLWRRRISGKATLCASAVSPCSRFLAVGGVGGWRQPNTLVVLHASSGRVEMARSELSLGTTSTLSALAYHPSGWLAVGFGNGEIRHISFDGTEEAYSSGEGSVRALAFNADGTQLLIGGAKKYLRRVELRPAWNGVGGVPEPRRTARFREWNHHNADVVPSRELAPEPEDILELDPWDAASRLAVLEDADEVLARLRSTVRGGDGDQGWAVALAAAKRATGWGGVLPGEYYDLVSSLAIFVHMRRREMFREIVAAIRPADRVRVVLRDLSLPAWERFLVLAPSEAAGPLVAMIEGWPRGIYTQLKKKHGAAMSMRLTVGDSAKEFWRRAEQTLVELGQPVVPELERALAAGSIHKALYRSVLDTLR